MNAKPILLKQSGYFSKFGLPIAHDVLMSERVTIQTYKPLASSASHSGRTFCLQASTARFFSD